MATQEERLRGALEERRVSARKLSMLLAARKGTKAENERRTVARWLVGLTISDENAEHLAAVLDYPDNYFILPPSERRPTWREEAEELREAVADLQRRLQELEEGDQPLPLTVEQTR